MATRYSRTFTDERADIPANRLETCENVIRLARPQRDRLDRRVARGAPSY